VTISHKTLCWVYGIVGCLALVGTWGNVLGLVTQLGFIGGTIQFWKDTLANGASRFITVDILFLGLSVMIWMVLEARRLQMRGVWLYIVFGILIAISLAVPLFMIHRQRTLAARDPSNGAGIYYARDVAAVLTFALLFITYAVVALCS
jgi:uncharacterized protein DUF2834